MHRDQLIPDGSWIDVSPVPEGGVAVVCLRPGPTVTHSRIEATRLHGETGSTVLWRVEVAPPASTLHYLRAAVDGQGRVAAIGQGKDGGCWLTRDGQPLEYLGVTFGVFCVEIRGLPEGGWQVAVLRPGAYELLSLPAVGTIAVQSTTVTDTTQGFIQIDQGVILQDLGRQAVPGLILAEQAGGWAAGQNRDAGPDRIRLTDGTRYAALVQSYAQPPHVVTAKDGSVWVSSWLREGAWVAGYSPDAIPWNNESAPPKPPVAPPSPDQGLARPKVTIAQYAPQAGVSPLSVRAVAEIDPASGPVETLQWRYRPRQGGVWTLDAVSPASDRDHTYVLTEPGLFELSLYATGPGGFDQTVKVREVSVSEPVRPPEPPEPEIPEPEPEPLPPEAVPTAFRCSDGVHYLCADLDVVDEGGEVRLVADRVGVGQYETFAIEPLGDGKVALRAFANNRYLHAADGGGAGVYADRSIVGEHEQFYLDTVAGQPECYAIRTVTGQYLCAEDGGGGEVSANRDTASSWETFASTTPLQPEIAPGPGPGPGGPITGIGIHGQLRLHNGALVDDTGDVLPLFWHGGDLMAEWLHNGAFVDDLLQKILAAGFDGVRFWSSLGWTNHPKLGTVHLGPRYQANYYDLLGEWLTKLRHLGLVAHMAPGSLYPEDVGDDQDAFARGMGQVVQAVGAPVIALFEGANESRDTCPGWDSSRLARFVDAFTRECPSVLTALSAYTGHEDAKITNDYSRSPAKVATYHQMRLSRLADMIQHGFSFRYIGTEYKGQNPPSVMVEKSVIWNGEGTGYGQLVTGADQHWMNDRTMAAYAGAMLTFHQPYNYFSGPGVKCASEPAETMPGFYTVAQTRALLPRDIMRWKIFHGGETWTSERVFAADADTRAAHALAPDGRFAVWLYGGDVMCPQVRGTVTSWHDYGDAKLALGHL